MKWRDVYVTYCNPWIQRVCFTAAVVYLILSNAR